jgi:hypothetical protein
MPTYLKTALYFEDRAKRTRHEEERERLLAVARRYRGLATHESRYMSESGKGQLPVETHRRV